MTPFWVRNCPEKLLVLQFPDLIPPTAIARDLSTIRAFKETRHGDIILKPLYGNGGALARFPAGPQRPQSVQPVRAFHLDEPRAFDRAEIPA